MVLGMSSVVATTTASVVGDKKDTKLEQENYKKQLMECDEVRVQVRL